MISGGIIIGMFAEGVRKLWRLERPLSRQISVEVGQKATYESLDW